MLARKLGVSADYLETGSEIRDIDERELRIADAELELRLVDEHGDGRGDAAAPARRGSRGGRRGSPPRARNVALGLAAAMAGRNAEAIERLEAGLELIAGLAERPGPMSSPRSAAPTRRPAVPTRPSTLFERCLGEVSDGRA